MKNQKTDKDKKIGEKGMTPEVEAEFNSMKEQVKKTNETITNLTETLSKERKEKDQTKYQSEVTTLESEIIKELANQKITEKSCVNSALGLIDRMGLAKINKEDDGSLKRFITTHAEDGAVTSSDLEGLASYVAKTNPRLVNPSGKVGTGENHGRESDNTGGGKIVKNHSEALQSFEAGLK